MTNNNPTRCVNLSDAKTALKVGFTNVIEMDAWESTSFGSVTVTAGMPEITYLLQAGGATVYFGGDTLRGLRDARRASPTIGPRASTPRKYVKALLDELSA
jgi:hypothetical protein